MNKNPHSGCKSGSAMRLPGFLMQKPSEKITECRNLFPDTVTCSEGKCAG